MKRSLSPFARWLLACFNVSIACLVLQDKSLAASRFVDVPFLWDLKFLNPNSVSVKQDKISAGGKTSDPLKGNLRVRFLHTPPTNRLNSPALPDTKVTITSKTLYSLVCNAYLFCEENAAQHSSRIKIENEEIILRNSINRLWAVDSAKPFILEDMSRPIEDNPSSYVFDFVGKKDLIELISYDIDVTAPGIIGLSLGGFSESMTETTLTAEATNPVGFLTYEVEDVPGPLGIGGLLYGYRLSRILRTRILRKSSKSHN